MKGGAKLELKYRKHTNFHNGKAEDKVMQPSGDVIAAEGDTVTLDCTFETAALSYYLFWYKQVQYGSPKYILRRDTYGTDDNAAEFQKESFDVELNKTSVPLKIQKLHLSYSAVYYCALQPTVTGNSKILYKNLWSKDNRKLHNIH
uniref:Ig-like domain-containing protein n=1 Tax=Amphiprion percula TaxID=161767 RepID=A0A3P8SN15_AMPPE